MFRTTVALAAGMVLTLSTVPLEARSAKILTQFTNVSETASSFTISGKATGLAGGFTYTVALSGAVTGSAQCINPGGNDPAPKGFTLNVDAEVNVTADKNGNLLFTVTQNVPILAAADCPNDNWSVLATYSGSITISLFDATADPDLLLATQSNVQVSFP
jgi:hypothetical protein